MKRIEFEYYEDFACNIAEKLDSLQDELGNVSVIAKYVDAKNIIKELLYMGYDIASVNLHKENYEEYFDEYILDITSEEIWCEKFKRGDKYVKAQASAIYIMDNCSSKVITHCESDEIYEVYVDEDDDDEVSIDEESEREYTIDGEKVNKETFDRYISKFAPERVNNEKNKSISALSATYKINGKPVSKEVYEYAAEKIVEKYSDNIRDMLLEYCEFMDEMNDWVKRISEFRW